LHSDSSNAWIGSGDYNSILDTTFTFLRENPDIALNSAELEFAARCEINGDPLMQAAHGSCDCGSSPTRVSEALEFRVG